MYKPSQQREGGLRGSAIKKEQKVKWCREVLGNVSKAEEDGRERQTLLLTQHCVTLTLLD